MAGAQDSKAKRDSKFIEGIGAYYPLAESELERKEKHKTTKPLRAVARRVTQVRLPRRCAAWPGRA